MAISYISMVNFLRNYRTVLQILATYVSIFHMLADTWKINVFILDILKGVWIYILLSLIFITLMINHVGNGFISIFAIHISSSVKYPSKSFAHILLYCLRFIFSYSASCFSFYLSNTNIFNLIKSNLFIFILWIVHLI